MSHPEIIHKNGIVYGKEGRRGDLQIPLLNGNFLWPGYSENLRVLEWIIARCQGKTEAIKIPIGYVPTPTSLDMTGLDLPPKTLDDLFRINPEEWQEELKSQNEFFDKLGNQLPQEIRDEYKALTQRLQEAT